MVYSIANRNATSYRQGTRLETPYDPSSMKIKPISDHWTPWSCG